MLRVRMDTSPELKRGLREAPQIMDDYLRPAHEESAQIVQSEIRGRISELGLISRRRLYNSVRHRVTGKGQNLAAIVGVGSRGGGPGSQAALLNYGGTVKPKRGNVMRFPIKDYALFEQSASGRQYKRARFEAIGERWVTLKQFTIKPRRFVYAGTKRGEPTVKFKLARAGVQALRKIFGEGVV